ncbi:DNA gyrase subunit A [Candidatus Woesearchaeota archaeon]|nr:DNA gyrase subunit A [Candidatus Woesearchaeota archaeon]
MKIVDKLIDEEMRSSYLDYAMSVIIGRALPDIRDGLKPVHRRIIYAMNEQGMQHNKPYKKCARIVGEVLGKYHPHGDSAVYDSLVRMAQPFSLRYPLIQGQGNFGSVDGDNAAAMRYTEARMARIADELVVDIEKDTVVFCDNFDGSLKEPTVLPSRLPNLLLNGSSGIAVGMATSIPPHNLRELCNGIIRVIDNPETPMNEILDIIKGPDFPTGGLIIGDSGIRHAYATGRGKIKVRARTEIEETTSKKKIIITEIPYMVNKSMLIEEIAAYVRDKTIAGIGDIRDESDKRGMRVVLELKRDANEEVVLNHLFKYTRMQVTFSINMLALVENNPKVLTLKEMIIHFIKHRRTVVIRRTRHDLKKAQERAHILEGLIIALDDIDKAIAIIKRSKSVAEATEALMASYKLSEIQSKAILDMRLQKLTNLEQGKIREEHKKLQELIIELKAILESEIRVMNIIKEEIASISEKYSDERRTEIVHGCFDDDIDIEDLIDHEDDVITITHSGYIKRIPLATYKAQRRGGKGIVATTTREEDVVEHVFVADTHDFILFFTDDGQVNWLKVWKIPEAGRYSSGKAIVNLLDIPKERKITAFVRVTEFDDSHYLVMATENGTVKKTNLSAYSRPRAGGIRAIVLDEGDRLMNVMMTDGEQNILLATKNGMAVKFNEADVRTVGRVSRGVRGIRLRDKDRVVGMVNGDDSSTLITITENGFGKRTRIIDYRHINRGGIGVRNIICSERNGNVVAIKAVTDDDEMMFISRNGIIIRTPVAGISVIGRNTQGLRLMRMKEGDKVQAAALIHGNGEE